MKMTPVYLWTKWIICELGLGHNCIYKLAVYSFWVKHDDTLDPQILMSVRALCSVVFEMFGYTPSSSGVVM